MKPYVNNRVAVLREKLAKSIGLPFARLLPESLLEEIIAQESISYRKRLFCPIVTLWAWLSQVLDSDKSCKNAVSRIVAYLVGQKQEIPSTNTSAYCQARARLSERLLLRLLRESGIHQHQQSTCLWCGRDVFVVDGSSFVMADTAKNQEVYPQHQSQAQGCGFPLARLVVLFSLFTGSVVDVATGAFCIGEVNLFRQLYCNLIAGSITLGDRLFGSYADICLLAQRRVDSVFRLHGSREVDFQKGKHLSRWDHIVYWNKPKRRPIGISKATFDLLPEQLLLREVRFHVQQKGFRTEVITLVTTLLDHKTYSQLALAQLYQLRWQAEINLRHLKTTMQMEQLLSKTPEMVRKELYVHLLAYNLIRQLQWEAFEQHHSLPIELSFLATIGHLRNFLSLLAYATDEQRGSSYQQLIVLIAGEKLLYRSDRVEPRAVFRRPKKYQRLNRPRQELKRKCMHRKIDPKTGKSSPSY